MYCPQCGEKQPHHHDLTLGHFLHDLLHELVHLDSKLFRTLRELVLKPGELTVAYFAGRKTRYIAPLRIFLTLFALQFLAYTVYKPVAIYSLDGLFRFDTSQKFEGALERAAAKRKIPYPQLVEQVEHRWQKNMSMLNLAGIAGFAAVLKLLYARRRRYLAEHLIFASHYMSFAYLVSLVIWPVYLVIGLARDPAHYALMAVMLVCMCAYLYLAMRRFYQQSGGKTLAKAVLAWCGMYVVNVIIMAGSLVGAVVWTLG